MSYRTSLPLHPTEDDKPKKKKTNHLPLSSAFDSWENITQKQKKVIGKKLTKHLPTEKESIIASNKRWGLKPGDSDYQDPNYKTPKYKKSNRQGR